MGGGLMQLVAYGAQDIYLTGQPQITFFKSVYRRHTNFSIESILQTINGTASPGSRVSVTVSRNGDLLKNLWIQYDPSALIVGDDDYYLGCDFGHALLQQVELEIGGQLIDRQFGLWLTVWRELSEVNPTGMQARLHWGGQEPPYPNSGDQATIKESWELPTKYQKMSYTHKGYPTASGYGGSQYAPKRAYIPMAFWFCKNPGLAVPLIALQYHEVKFNITFAPTANFVLPDTTAPSVDLNSVVVYADYVYLDTTERRQFAQNAHEYLIDQLQVQTDGGSSSSSQTIRLNFNHPVKELIWCGTPVPVTSDGYWNTNVVVTGGATPYPVIGSISTSTTDHNQPAQSSLTSKIVLNGTDRFTERHLTYFTRNQIWDCHTGFGATANYDSIGVYSFALRPEEHQPSGTCNFSRIDTAQLVFNNASINGETVGVNPLTIFAVNYNVLRIMSGMGGLAYSN